ncbi:histidine phosphatase family protein [Nanoarchaeota archaeon]
MKLILTRHGETEENRKLIMQGQSDGKLSADGISQAKKLALRLKDEKIDCIYSSDLSRAADTAKEIAVYHPDVPFEVVAELRECSLGVMEGKTKKEMGFSDGERPPKELRDTCEGFDVLFSRAENFLHKVLSKHADDVVLFVAHSIINRALIAVITGKGHEDVPFVERVGNASVSVFEIDEDKNHKIHLFNCVGHLE